MGTAISSEKYTPDGMPYYTLDEFKKLDKLDSGGYGTVMKGYDKKKRPVAVKIFSKLDLYSKREIIILKNHTHENIIELFGVLWAGKIADDNEPEYIGYVMEFMEHGNLHNEIHDYTKTYNKTCITLWIKQIGSGLEYLHKHGIIHRDVKPKNILLAERHRVKLADFGLARNISNRHSNTSGIVGTGSYIAPEVLMSNDYGPPADVFSFGVTIWEIVHRKHPSECLKVIRGTVENSCVILLPMEPSKINRRSSMFLKRCWSTEVTERPSVQDIIRNGISKPSSTLLVTRSDYKTAILDQDRDKWINVEIDSLAEIPPESDLLCLDDDLYMINVHSYGILYKLDKNMKWIRMADMNVKRTQIKNNCLSYNGFIWVFGGEDSETGGIVCSVEKYDPIAEKWIEMPEMKYARCSAAVVGYHDKIIICGGIGPQPQAQYSLECFDLKSGLWTELCLLPIPLALGHSISYYKHWLIIMGGCDEYGPSTAVLKWDISTEEWTELKTWWLREGSQFMAGITMDEELFAFCGPWKKYSHMSRIDISGNYIEKVGAPIPSEPFYETCVVITERLANRLCRRGRRQSKLERSEIFTTISGAIEENFSEWKKQFGAEW